MAKSVIAPYGEAEHKASVARSTREQTAPTAVRSAWYDVDTERLFLDLQNGVSVALPVADIQELAGHSADELREVMVTPGRDGLIWQSIDVGISAPGLLTDFFGSAVRSRLGGIGGKRQSDAKANAARANGAKGGRPPVRIKIAAAADDDPQHAVGVRSYAADPARAAALRAAGETMVGESFP